MGKKLLSVDRLPVPPKTTHEAHNSAHFLGIDELSIQLEEPFSMLPLHQLVAGIGMSAEEHFEWNEKDYIRYGGNVCGESNSITANGGTVNFNDESYSAFATPSSIERYQDSNANQEAFHHEPQPQIPTPTSQQQRSSFEQTRAVETTPVSEWDYLAKASATMKQSRR